MTRGGGSFNEREEYDVKVNFLERQEQAERWCMQLCNLEDTWDEDDVDLVIIKLEAGRRVGTEEMVTSEVMKTSPVVV